MIDITNAKASVGELHEYLAQVAHDIVDEKAAELDKIIKSISSDGELMNNEQLRLLMMRISVEAYNLSQYREDSSLKEACAVALYKEGIANSFNQLDGTVESRKNKSTTDNMDKQAVSILYSAVSEIFKAKTDEAHRMANVINGILISRAADAKLQYSPRSEEEEIPF